MVTKTKQGLAKQEVIQTNFYSFFLKKSSPPKLLYNSTCGSRAVSARSERKLQSVYSSSAATLA